MSRKHKSALNDFDSALAAMGAEELRELVRDILPELDDRAHRRVVNSLINRAARGGSGWAPVGLTDDEVTEVLAFAKVAKRVGAADPSEVDGHLYRGSGAFLRKDYTAAHRIFGALLRLIGEGEIDLGQHEMVDEVLGVDPAGCAAQYVVASYMLAVPTQRAEAVRAAIEDVRGLGHFWEPIREMERVALEPLPQLDDFLSRWRAVVTEKAECEPRSDMDTEQGRWLREVVRRMDGSDGLAKIARATRRADDLRAWCRSLVAAGDWKAALAAFEEAAELVADKEYAKGELLDGAALAAWELGRSGLPGRLERAWRAGPNMLRLRRWFGSARNRTEIKKRATAALDVCPKQAHRQRAFLHLLLDDFEPAAKLLAAAPGLGWSDGEHPGHLVFPLFETLLAGKRPPAPPGAPQSADRGMDIEALDLETLEQMTAADEAARLPAPHVSQILDQAGVVGIPDASTRNAVLAAMRKAAESRLAGVTGQKRRRHYGHAAELVATCLACDRSPEGLRWVASIKVEHRRFPALRTELERRVGSS